MWHQVAHTRVALQPTVHAQTQRYRGQPWVVLEDAYSNRFFRVTPQAYAFVRSLHAGITVDEAWHGWAQAQPDKLPTQDDVVRLLSQLHLSNLLFFGARADEAAIAQRTQTQRRRELTGKALSFLFIRVPLFSPQRWLNNAQTLVRACTGPMAAALWLAVVVAGSTALFQRGEAAWSAGQGLLSLSNLPWLYLSLALVKALHEAGHAFVCARYGGQVPTVGMMFLVFTPMPYVDASASWGLRNKWQRAYVGAAGMLVELFTAAVAALVWAHTSDGLVHSLAFNVMVVGSVSSLLFNGNPLLRYDAYYILSDLAELPNLYQKAQAQWLYYGSRFVLGMKEAVASATSRSETWWYSVYGALAFAYRWLVTVGVLFFVADQWFALGVVLLATTAITMVAMPLFKLATHLQSAAWHAGRTGALLRLGAVLGVLLLLLVALPLPHAERLPGVLQAHRSQPVYAPTPGRLVSLAVQHGQTVKQGDLLARLDNPELDTLRLTSQAQMAEVQAQLRQAFGSSLADVGPLQSRAQALHERMQELQRMHAQLVIRAEQDGEWVAPALHERVGAWLDRSAPLGEVVDRRQWRFHAVLSQEQAAELFSITQPQGSELRLLSAPGRAVAVQSLERLPYQRQRLASAALGMAGGGDIAVRTDDASGMVAAEAFFEIIASASDLGAHSQGALHGVAGVLRVPVGQRTLWQRGRAAMQQLLQQRYTL